ncbi:hypothetical protein Tco_0336724 [Tanacetum coccineum]
MGGDFNPNKRTKEDTMDVDSYNRKNSSINFNDFTQESVINDPTRPTHLLDAVSAQDMYKEKVDVQEGKDVQEGSKSESAAQPLRKSKRLMHEEPQPFKMYVKNKGRSERIAKLQAKDELQNAYKKCTDIPQEKRVLIDTFLKQESDKDYEMHNALRLRSEQEKEVMLANNLLGEMTRYLLQMRSRAEEETSVHSLPFDQPLNSYGLHTLLMSSESDTRITTALEAAREEVIRSINEKQELINNYRAI